VLQLTPQCACGCGTPLQPRRRLANGTLIFHRFVNGHNVKGLKRSEATIAKISGSNSHLYKHDDDLGYQGIHRRILKVKPKMGICQHCGRKQSKSEKAFDHANVSGQYLLDPDDYLELCKKCHNRFDAVQIYGKEGCCG
jgi:hypothetical protein